MSHGKTLFFLSIKTFGKGRREKQRMPLSPNDIMTQHSNKNYFVKKFELFYYFLWETGLF